MNTSIHELLEQLENGRILNKPLVRNDQMEAALDSRNDPEFDNNWIKLYELVGSKNNITDSDKIIIDRIRELSFKITFKHSSSPDLAGYVSDDFELIAKCLVLNIADSWCDYLFATYQKGLFPCGIR